MAEPHLARPARTLGPLLAAAAIVVTTVVLVATLGLAEPPPLDPVDAASRPDRSLAVLTWRDEGGQCLLVVAPAGTVREVRCGLEATGPLLGWDDEGIIVLRYVAGAEQRETIDPATGTTVARAVLSDGMAPVPAERLPAGSERRDGRLIVRDADGRELWRVDAPEAYGIQGSAFAPDGTLAMIDTAERLLVLAPDGTAPRVWVDDLGAGWAELVWEGTPAVRE
jgi:hypothetical protein